jgi:hypothetical protein
LKRPGTYWLLIYSILLLVTVGLTFIQIDREVPDTTRIYVTTTFEALAHMDGKLNPTGPFNERSSGGLFRPGLIQSCHFSLLGRYILSFWSKLFESRQRINILGFFFPAMILLFFIQFYQSSRTSSEGKPGI